MLLIYTHKITPRLTYTFKQCCSRILGIPIAFTTKVEEFVAHKEMKLSYTTKQLGGELHIKSTPLLFEQGIVVTDINVSQWDGVPCFFSTAEAGVLPYDIFAAAFYLLSRYEEYLPHLKDSEGRFPMTESIAYQHDFLERPIIDIWLMRFKEVLKEQYPDFIFVSKPLQTRVVIDVHRAFAYRKVGFLRTIGGYFRDFFKFRLKRNLKRTQVLLGLRKDPYDVFNWLTQIQKRVPFKFQYFFALGDYTNQNRTIKYSKASLQSLMKMVADYSDVGLLVSHTASFDMDTLRIEKQRLEQTTHRPLCATKITTHQFVIPDTYQYLLEQEVKMDFTIGYPNHPGFRAGTSHPFLFYDINYETQTPLQLFPLCLTMGQVFNPSKKTLNEIKISQLKQTVTDASGHFVIGFSNVSFTSTIVRTFFKKLVLNEA